MVPIVLHVLILCQNYSSTYLTVFVDTSPTTFTPEITFSAVAVSKTQYRDRLSVSPIPTDPEDNIIPIIPRKQSSKEMEPLSIIHVKENSIIRNNSTRNVIKKKDSTENVLSFLPEITSDVLIYKPKQVTTVIPKISTKREISIFLSDPSLSITEKDSECELESEESSFIFNTDSDSPDDKLKEDSILMELSQTNDRMKESMSARRNKIRTAMKATKKQSVNRGIALSKEIPLTTDELGQINEPLDFLSKYCIILEHRLPAYENVFKSVVESQKVECVSRSASMDLNIQKKSKRNHKKSKQDSLNLLSKREESVLKKDIIYNHIKYQLPPGENYTEIEIQKTKFQIRDLLEKREDLKKTYDKRKDNLENNIALKIKEKFPQIVSNIKYSKNDQSEITNKEVVKKIDSLIRKKISKMKEFSAQWVELNQLRKQLNQTTLKILNLKMKKQKLEVLKVQQKKTEEINVELMKIKRDESIIYQTVHPDMDKEISIEDLESALQVVNRHLLSQNEFHYIYHILKLPQHSRINMQTFSCIAALSEKVTRLEPFTKRLINKFDFNALDSKMEKAKKLFFLMANKDDKLFYGMVSVKSLIIELKAGGISDRVIESIIHKFDRESKGFVDFLDFLTYIPLFVEIHERIIDDPLKTVKIDFNGYI